MLDVQGLRAGYGQSEVLHGIDFTVAPGEIVVFVGRNGMGKTTLMKSLIGLVPATAGRIALGGGGHYLMDVVVLGFLCLLAFLVGLLLVRRSATSDD